MSAAVRRARAFSADVLSAVALARVAWLGIALAVLATAAGGAALLPRLGTTLVHWDAIAYLDIAQHGYPARLDYHDAFLPGFPLLVRIASVLTRDYVTAAFVVNTAAEVVALWYVFRLVAAERDRSAAQFSVWVLALAPTAVFLLAPFTESPFIACAAAALFYGRRRRMLAASLAAAAASIIRLTGLALIPALILEVVVSVPRRSANALHILLVPLPLLAYCLYMQAHIGDALALYHAERLPSFGQTPAAPWDGLAATWNTMMTTRDAEVRSIFAREVAFGVLGLLACAGMWASRRIPRSLALYCTIAWLMTASLSFWRSEPRYLLALFPALLLLSDVTARRRTVRAAAVIASAALMCGGTWIYARGAWLG